MEVSIFKTNVKDEILAVRLSRELQVIIPDFQINFDLEDCDKILRLSGRRKVSDLVVSYMNTKGYECSEIE